MEAVSDTKESVLRAKLEFGVMRSAFERSHLAWSNARAELKPSMLLSGQTLTRAEGWLHDFPEKLSDSEKSFIMASIAKNSMDGQRDGTIIEQVLAKSSNGTFWLVVVTFFLIVRLFIPMAVEQLTGVSVKANDPDAPVVAAQPKGQRDGAADEADNGADEDGKGQSQAGMDDEPDSGTMSAAALQRQAKLEAQRQLRQYSELARGQIAKGQARTAMLLAIEAAHRAGPDAAPDVAATSVATAGSLIIESLARRIADGPTPAAATKGPAALFCGQASTVVMATANAAVRVLRVDSKQPVSELRSRDLLLRGAAVGGTCETMVLAGEDHTAEIWSLGAARRVAVLAGHEADIQASAISSDGSVIATGGQDAVVRLWDGRGGRRKAVLEGHDWTVNSVAFSPDGKRLVTASADKTARVWLVDEGRSIMTLAGHAGAVTNAHFSPDGLRILTIGLDGHATLWDAASGQQLRRLQHSNTAIMQARFSPDGRQVVGLTQDGRMVVWPSTGEVVAFDRSGPAGIIREFAISPDGETLLTTSWRGEVGHWSMASGRLLSQADHVAGKVEVATFAEDGKRAVALLNDGSLVSWPLLGAPSEAIKYARSVVGACLTAQERTDLGLAGDAPDWCAASTPARQAE